MTHHDTLLESMPTNLDDALQSVDHIVVLMLENRAFDHMLGYLSMPLNPTGDASAIKGRGREDIEGLRPGMSNPYDGVNYPIFHQRDTQFDDEPCHDWECVQRQLEGDNQGFVWDFHGLPHRKQDAGQIMGCYTGEELPMYDFLAEHFCVCDHWHASVPGPTWPNRLYSISGSSRGDKNNSNRFPPDYDMATIFQHLEAHGREWRYYAHWRPGAFLRTFSAHRLDPRISEIGAFYAACRDAKLPDVSWIEPDFGLSPVIDPLDHANDDHPPGDVAHGQLLVANVYEALRRSPLWSKTLLVVTYDEHGGFFDHLVPPACEDDRPEFRRLGVRVPAFVISPRMAPRSVAKTTFDHTTLLKTILLRFCRDANNVIPDMGARTRAAPHLWGLIDVNAAVRVGPAAPALAQPALPRPDDGTRSDMELQIRALGERYLVDAKAAGGAKALDQGHSAPPPLTFAGQP